MKEIQNIIEKTAKFSDGEKAILATVVDVDRFGLSPSGSADAD